ncbi:MAG TPA: hypothetical protein VGH48_14065, partial [Caldimonas sp.]
SDGDAAGGASGVQGAHRHGRGGHMGHAVMDALQSLGLSVPQTAPSAGGDAATGGNGQDASSSTSAIQSDVHDLMHTLFEAVKGEQTAAGGATNGAADPSHSASSFSSGLSALISQVAGGNAPADLQTAFTKLESDLQANSAASSAGNATPVTLQAFLSKLQDSLGYGASGTSTATGNITSSAA